jgi:hypothetical protein
MINTENLTAWQAFATIFATLATPLIVACLGYVIQDRIASGGLQKEYVQIALAILKEDSTKPSNQALRPWAVELLNENASVKLSPEQKRTLIADRLVIDAVASGGVGQSIGSANGGDAHGNP